MYNLLLVIFNGGLSLLENSTDFQFSTFLVNFDSKVEQLPSSFDNEGVTGMFKVLSLSVTACEPFVFSPLPAGLLQHGVH